MCEPLRGKKQRQKVLGGLEPDYHYFGFEDVKSAVEFYKKYRYHKGLILLKEKEQKVYDKFHKYMEDKFGYTKEQGLDGFNEIYDIWLFDYCFGDIQ